jgi:hypothetical protein
MFGSLIAFFQNATNWLDWLWRTIWNQLCSLAAILWAVVLLLAGLMFSFLQHLNTDLAQAAGYIDALTFPNIDINGAGGPIYNALSLANTFTPLTELCGFLAIYIALLGALQLIRGIHWVWSWIWGGGS